MSVIKEIKHISVVPSYFTSHKIFLLLFTVTAFVRPSTFMDALETI